MDVADPSCPHPSPERFTKPLDLFVGCTTKVVEPFVATKGITHPVELMHEFEWKNSTDL